MDIGNIASKLYITKYLQLSTECVTIKSRGGSCDLAKSVLGYFTALPLLVVAGAAFFMFEIVIRIRLSVIVIFILTASLLQIHTDLSKFGSAARPYSLD